MAYLFPTMPPVVFQSKVQSGWTTNMLGSSGLAVSFRPMKGRGLYKELRATGAGTHTYGS